MLACIYLYPHHARANLDPSRQCSVLVDLSKVWRLKKEGRRDRRKKIYVQFHVIENETDARRDVARRVHVQKKTRGGGEWAVEDVNLSSPKA
jgi:hypothetical protein